MPVDAARATPTDPERVAGVQQALLEWYAVHGRDLPWRRTRDPYAVLVAEIMLQQTQVARVLPKWHAWLAQFPTLAALAAASRADVIRAWQGLGYNLRAVRLHDIAQQVVSDNAGQLPPTLDRLLALKGIGRYTAGAVACFAFEQPVAMVDTNVRRVLGRVLLGVPRVPREAEALVQRLAEQVVPPASAYAWNQALMDLGATLCSAERPACLVCPLLRACRAAPLMGAWPAERRRVAQATARPLAAERIAAAERAHRGRVVDVVRGLSATATVALLDLGQRVRTDFDPAAPTHTTWLERLVRKLAADGLVRLDEEAGLRVGLP